ncbi:hypothetical protein ACJ73_03034 [Blastomyces percursus]|uniref:Chromo domain-containing protein n=1 Tax=Blastomyces percursus TaxID=1658174 RepID=A0A1J9RD62_9EURO|nr:hypothetical protein ACJ73_03034 [Blastomyces percursus]
MRRSGNPVQILAETRGQYPPVTPFRTCGGLHSSILYAKDAEKKYYDQCHIPKTFSIGDWVMLRSKNITTLRPSRKLDHRFLGPFQIIDIRGKQAYKLRLTPQYRGIHPVFHVSLLEPYHARDGKIPEAQPILISAQEEWEVESILDKRKYRGETQYLVKWKNCTEAENSWEPPEHLEHCQEYLYKLGFWLLLRKRHFSSHVAKPSLANKMLIVTALNTPQPAYSQG